jgi:hypothetical protein
VSESSEPLRKHRHDLGHEDHGAKLAQGTTRGIQILLGLWIALTFCLFAYALIDGSRLSGSDGADGSTGPSAGQERATDPSVTR